ncbi:ammonia-forming cytochrome c nitrite reductase subunit c552 [Puniceicoccales bacterium CK1056]|uniref:Ammonia-forming cytochrome c nitrite reductase subunit c552 n=1 Tax=Oceanipulchritudo coccoides TaxID=2706888 RepID=A0A6B2M5J4_9BACT|nr:ammonia-forming cytochrome c nitrite reductase subunit c552 [Oceanipulchritudo coccoides]NDV63075.1 ammonia-forming cytochrome c nitrite reductase subunit c552 [Oceanipulchritudo coccoides]
MSNVRLSKPLLIAIALLVLSTVGILFYYSPDSSVSEAPEVEAILTQFDSPGKLHADPANCIECHREITEAWETSHHALANAPLSDVDRDRLLNVSDELVQARGINWKSQKSLPIMEEPGLPEYPVIGSIGLTPLIQYLHLAPDGRLQAHDVAWDVEKKEWFSVFELDDKDEETPRMSGEWGHWTGQGMNWDANCAYCHMTEYHKKYDVDENIYKRKWSHMGITCAQCHPNMDVHMDQIHNGNNAFVETLSPEQIMETCATCHARREELTKEGFRPGDEFEDHYELTLASVPGIYHPDGQVIGENYVYGSLMMSKMGHAGVTCMDCHDPHTNGHILPFENNALCMRCHGSGLNDAPKINPTAHSRHKTDSTGNQCVECHMPVTYFMGRDGRRDHSFSNPDPQLTIEMGVPNACTQCHNTQSNEWAKRYTDEWYGPEMNADRRTKAALMRDLFAGTTGADARLRAAIDTEKNRFWKSTFISMLQYTPPDQENFQVLVGAVSDPDPMVRSTAVRTVGLDSLGPETGQSLMTDPSRSVRISAAISNGGMRTATQDHEAELKEYLEHTADSPMGALRLSGYWQSRGNIDKAAMFARRSTEFEPLNPEVWRVSAVALHGMGKSAEAVESLEKGRTIAPENPDILFNLGLIHYELGDPNKALSHLNAAVEADPQFESAWYNMILLYWQLEERETAMAKLQGALEAIPQGQRLRQLAGSLR